MKILLVIVASLGFSFVTQAQCEEKIFGKQLEKGMFIHCDPGRADKTRYVAEILSVNGTDFSCRFLHSNAVYQFRDFKRKENGSPATMQAVVKSSKGGGYAEGAVFTMNAYMVDPDACNLSGATESQPYDIIATFKADKKRYLGRMKATSTGYTIQFAHTQSVYTVDKNFKVTGVNGGGYIVGSQMEVVHARTLQF